MWCLIVVSKILGSVILWRREFREVLHFFVVKRKENAVYEEKLVSGEHSGTLAAVAEYMISDDLMKKACGFVKNRRVIFLVKAGPKWLLRSRFQQVEIPTVAPRCRLPVRKRSNHSFVVQIFDIRGGDLK
jgi:hypothetical protein